MTKHTFAYACPKRVHRWLAMLIIAVGSIALSSCNRAAPAATAGAWQVIAFTPNKESNASGALLLNTATGETWALGGNATTWLPLHDIENQTVPKSAAR